MVDKQFGFLFESTAVGGESHLLKIFEQIRERIVLAPTTVDLMHVAADFDTFLIETPVAVAERAAPVPFVQIVESDRSVHLVFVSPPPWGWPREVRIANRDEDGEMRSVDFDRTKAVALHVVERWIAAINLEWPNAKDDGEWGDLTMDSKTFMVSTGNSEVKLSGQIRWRLMAYLVDQRGVPRSASEIAAVVWSDKPGTAAKTVERECKALSSAIDPIGYGVKMVNGRWRIVKVGNSPPSVGNSPPK